MAPLHLVRLEKGRVLDDRVLVPNARTYNQSRAALWVNARRADLPRSGQHHPPARHRDGRGDGADAEPHHEVRDARERHAHPRDQRDADLLDLPPRRRQHRAAHEPLRAASPTSRRTGASATGWPTPAARCAARPRRRQHQPDDRPRLEVAAQGPRLPLLPDGVARTSGCWRSAPRSTSTVTSTPTSTSSSRRSIPRRLEVIGTAVRYSFSRGQDRFPDVFVAGHELGRQRGEAPFARGLPPGPGRARRALELRLRRRLRPPARTASICFARAGRSTA